MDPRLRHRLRITEIPVSMTMLAFLLWFHAGIFIRIPYAGLYFDPNSGAVLDIYVPQAASLQPGDILVKVGGVLFSEYKASAILPLFPPGLRAGQVIPILVERDGNELLVRWEMPGINPVELRGRLFNIYWLSYIYWLFGALVEMFIRPRDTRWRLLIAANHLTGLWLMLGAISSWRVLGAALLFHALSWLILPLYLHLHWIFPQPLQRLPKFSGILLYSAAGLMTAAELAGFLPAGLFYLAALLALGGSIALLVLHLILRPKQRRPVLLLALSAFLGVLPAFLMGMLGLSGEMPVYAPLALIAFALTPAAYLYLIFRNQLGGLEARANRFISTLAFLTLVSILLIVIAHAAASLPGEISPLLMIALPLLISAFSIARFPQFEEFIEKNIFGIKLPYQRLPESYSRRIAVSASLPSLLELLEKEVFPSLFIRQYAFLQANDKRLSPLLSKDIPDESFDFDNLAHRAGRYLPSLSPQTDWLRLILPLEAGDSTLGFWLLGKRDPDDHYPQAEIPILQSLADQTAIALGSILRAEQLRSLYQTDIERAEHERKSLSRDLHDSVLNQLAAMRNSLDETSLPPGFLSAYEELKHRIREIISNLRPPMLDQGLAYALTEFAEDMREKNGGVNITLNLQASEERLPENIETHLFHIVREACQNALRHADARSLVVSGVISPRSVDLSIEDDGTGFDPQTELNALLMANHFGIANMKERAHLIGADLTVRSRKNQGTDIRVTWKLK